MLEISPTAPSSYPIIAWANNQELVYYHEFGSYQGEWVMISRDEEKYYIYKDYFGSCSGCDSYQAKFDYSDDITKEVAIEFAKDYQPFAIIPKLTMVNLVKNNTLLQIFPANIRDEFSEVSVDEVAADSTIFIKLIEGIDITAKDILECKDQEIKQRALKNFGYEKFVKEINFITVDEDGENKLIRANDIVFAYVKDASTSRRYLLRVPPSMERIKQAIAWTFNMNENEYKPVIES